MNRKTLWTVVGLAVAALLIWLLAKPANSPYSVKPSPSGSVSPSASSSPKVTPKPSPSTLKYTDALNIYKDLRVQFDASCQMSPNSPTYKNGTAIMFDNRSSVARNIALDGTSYSLAPYGFRILTLYSHTLPHTIRINCGNAVNVGQIILQK